MGSEKGIDYLTVNANGKIGSIRHMGRAEGFIGIETCQNAVAIDAKGNAWFGTISGVTMYDPRTTIHNDKPPFLNITGINLFYESILDTRFTSQIGKWFDVKGELILEPEENHLGFEFIAINLPNPEGVNYIWKLEGLDKKWSPLSKNRSVTYSSLAPGKYIFKVRAINEDGVETKEVKSVSFTILPPFWKTWWFITLMTGIGIGIISFIFYLRVARIKQKSDVLRKELEMEKNALELEQKALRLQMNPHFIFNALNSIQALIVQKDEKTARLYLAKFSRLMRMILDNSRQGMIPLQAEINTLENYLAIEQFCSDDKFEYSIICNEDIQKDEILLPPMMIQPFVENAVIHGLRHLEKKGKVIVEFSLESKLLTCTITDNGIGREKATEIRAQNEQHHKSTALVVTQERLDILNKNSAVRPLEIIDLKDEMGEADGTRVIIRILQG